MVSKALCDNCQASLSYNRRGQRRKFCNRDCRLEFLHKQYLIANPQKNHSLPTGAVGAASEMIVCVDLINKGWEVFRAVSPASPCDLLIMRDGELLRVEVKTGSFSKGTNVPFYPRPKHSDAYDLLAIALGQEVRYFPKPELTFETSEEKRSAT